MFKCDNCKESSRYPHRVVAEKREKIYENHGKISKGTEIVKELNLCNDCYVKLGYDQSSKI